MNSVVIKKEKVGLLSRRHPWIYSGAVKSFSPGLKAGDLARLEDEKGRFLAYAFANPKTSIAARILSYDETFGSKGFVSARVLSALQERKILVPESVSNARRLINAEADGLPGLVVDLYDQIAVIQISGAGIEQRREELLDTLEEAGLSAVYERSNAKARQQEGLELRQGWARGQGPELVPIHEHGLRYLVPIENGQKTGFFIDQREMRLFVRGLAEGRSVFNGFSYTGGFSMNALKGGARRVLSVDSSAAACALLERQLQENGLDQSKHVALCSDVFVALREREESYDLVILDPPPFVKRAQDLKKATQHYIELNRLGLKRLKPGGLLFTYSCSPFMSEEDFTLALLRAGQQEGRSLKLLSTQRLALDHPVLLSHPEGRYIKGLLLQA